LHFLGLLSSLKNPKRFFRFEFQNTAGFNNKSLKKRKLMQDFAITLQIAEAVLYSLCAAENLFPYVASMYVTHKLKHRFDACWLLYACCDLLGNARQLTVGFYGCIFLNLA
jgi:hypothetical protein